MPAYGFSNDDETIRPNQLLRENHENRYFDFGIQRSTNVDSTAFRSKKEKKGVC
ncbi:hypothetical protein [Bacillus smithii]|uniref:hypothetical protein n=1 Tax=Bacillus smithii TaxID=1479 RepID=UPI0030CA0821